MQTREPGPTRTGVKGAAEARAGMWIGGLGALVWAGTLTWWMLAVPNPTDQPGGALAILLAVAVLTSVGMFGYYVMAFRRARS